MHEPFPISEFCPAFPDFKRLESDIAYYMDEPAVGKMTAADAVEYCRTSFSSPSYLPKFKAPVELAEVLTSVHLFTGK